jgi:hypothetical protein
VPHGAPALATLGTHGAWPCHGHPRQRAYDRCLTGAPTSLDGGAVKELFRRSQVNSPSRFRRKVTNSWFTSAAKVI